MTERRPVTAAVTEVGDERLPNAPLRPDRLGSGSPGHPVVLRRRNRLMPRDLALLRLLLSGMSLSQAAAELGVAIGTAKNRRHEVYQKLGVGTLANAARRLRELGIDLEATPRT